MTDAPDSAPISHDDDEFRLGSLLRIGSWGVGATAALFLAVLAGISNPGAARVDSALAALTGKTPVAVVVPAKSTAPTKVTESQPQPSLETRRLAEQVRLLAADRDRLLERLTAVEHNLDDVTGSIKRQEAVRAAAAVPAPSAPPAQVASASPSPSWSAATQAPTTWAPPATATPDAVPPPSPPEHVAAVTPAATPLPAPRPETSEAPEKQPDAKEAMRAPEPSRAPAKPPAAAPRQQAMAVRPNVAVRPEPTAGHATYGVDLGGAASVDRLRMLWNAVRSSQSGMFNGLHPIASVREAKNGGRPDIRLLVGPLRTPEDANRLCSALLDSGRFCEPAVFRGQRMPLR
jgi:hypothetical protein